MMRMEPPALYLPAENVEDVRRLLLIWQRLDRGRMVCHLNGLTPGQEVELSRDHVVTAFATAHERGFVKYVCPCTNPPLCAMTSTTVVIEGGACNKSFVLDLLAQPEVTEGSPVWADTGWIDRVRAEGRLVTPTEALMKTFRIGAEGLAKTYEEKIGFKPAGWPEYEPLPLPVSTIQDTSTNGS